MRSGSPTAWWRVLLTAMITTGASAAVIPQTTGPSADDGTALLPADLDRFDPAARAQLEALADAVDASPSDADAWRRLGMACQAYGQHELARRCYGRCVSLAPADAHGWYLLAVTHERLGEPDPAFAALRRAIALRPERAASHRLLAQWHLRHGRTDDAETAARRSRELDPNDPHVALLLARIALQRRDHDAAADLLRGVIAQSPENAYAHFLMGTALRGLGRLDEARTHLTRGRGAEPEVPDDWIEPVRAMHRGDLAAIRRALVALRRLDAAAAIALLEPLHERGVDDLDVVVNLARAFRMQGRVDEALSLLDGARQQRGDHHLISFQLAAAHRQMALAPGAEADERSDLRRRALAHADRAIALSPGFAPAHALRGDVLADEERLEPALEAYRRACSLGPDEPRWHAQLGTALCRAQRWGEAVAPLARAHDLDPSDPAKVHLLAAALANSGRLDSARTLLESALRERPADVRLRQALERVLAAQQTAAVPAR